MGDLKASPLHMISAIINAPRFHREIEECPPEITERCVHLLTALGRSRELAIQTNYEVMEFLARTISPFDDAGYMRVSRYFVQELLTVVGPQHKLWGAISYVMLSATPHLPEGEQLRLWKRINARFFEVLLDSRVISNEEEKRLKVKSVQGEVGPQPDLDLDEPQPDPSPSSKNSSVQARYSNRSREQSQEHVTHQRSSVRKSSTISGEDHELPEASTAPSEAVKLLGGVAISSNSSTPLPAPTLSQPHQTGSTTSAQSLLDDAQRSPKELPRDLKTLLSATPKPEFHDITQDKAYSTSNDTQASTGRDDQSSIHHHRPATEMTEALSTASSEVTFKASTSQRQRRPSDETLVLSREGPSDRSDLQSHDGGPDQKTDPHSLGHLQEESAERSNTPDGVSTDLKLDGQTADGASISDQATTIVGRSVKKANVRSVFGRRS